MKNLHVQEVYPDLEGNICSILDDWIRIAAGAAEPCPALGDLREISGELVFFDDEKAILIRLDQAKVMKSLHK